MKRIIALLAIVSIVMVFAVGCASNKPKSNDIVIKMGQERTLDAVVNELLDGGVMVHKEITGGHLRAGGEWTEEHWIIQDRDGNQHDVYVENGIIEHIDPVNLDQ
jgi:hypothetical protein